MFRTSTSSRVVENPPYSVRYWITAAARSGVKPGMAASWSAVARFRLTAPPREVLVRVADRAPVGARPDDKRLGTLTCSPSLRRAAMFGSRFWSASLVNPPAAAIAADTRSPLATLYRPGWATAPVTSTSRPPAGGSWAALAFSGSGAAGSGAAVDDEDAAGKTAIATSAARATATGVARPIRASRLGLIEEREISDERSRAAMPAG